MRMVLYLVGFGALGYAVYRLYTLISDYNLAGLPGGITDWMSNISTGQLTAAQRQEIANNASASVKAAGGSDQAAQAAAQEVLDFSEYSVPLKLHWYSSSIPSSYVIPCIGVDIYTLRKGGYSDADIAGFIDSCTAQELKGVAP